MGKKKSDTNKRDGNPAIELIKTASIRCQNILLETHQNFIRLIRIFN